MKLILKYYLPGLKKASYLSNLNKKNIINTIVQEPDIHIVFKKKEYLYSFEEQIKKSTEVSGFLKEKVNLKKIKSYNEGKWWVQDFSSFFPLYNFDTNLLNKSNLDLCAHLEESPFRFFQKIKILF